MLNSEAMMTSLISLTLDMMMQTGLAPQLQTMVAPRSILLGGCCPPPRLVLLDRTSPRLRPGDRLPCAGAPSYSSTKDFMFLLLA